jgi:hypothetical protein
MDIPEHVTLEEHLTLISDYREALNTIDKLKLELEQSRRVARLLNPLLEVSEIRVPRKAKPLVDQLKEAGISTWNHSNEASKQKVGTS